MICELHDGLIHGGKIHRQSEDTMKNLIIIAAATAVFLSAETAQGQPAAKFDLVCTGTIQFRPNGIKSPYEVRYRVDTDAKRWCKEVTAPAEAAIKTCDQPGPLEIQSVTPDRITFQDSDKDPHPSGTLYNYVSRIDGKLVFLMDQGSPPYGIFEDAAANCEAAPFTGFPAAKF